MGVRSTARSAVALALSIGLAVGIAGAAAAALGEERRVGPETNLPLPRYVSLNVAKANIRRGPGLSHRIDWVFLRRGAPLRIVAEHGHWRKVLDQDEAGGWIHHTLLRGDRTAVVVAADGSVLRAEPTPEARPRARLESGVVAFIDRCEPVWCLLETTGVSGWIPKSDVWGVEPDETFD